MTSAVLGALVVLTASALVQMLSRTPARTVVEPVPDGDGGWHVAARRGRTHRSVPSRWTQWRQRADRRRAWPGLADELAAELRSGASLRQALEVAAARGDLAGAALRRALVPVSRGDPLDRSASRWADVADDPDEALLAEAVTVAAGGARADPMLFDIVADTLRERAALAGEVRAQTAQARASALALSALPLAFTTLLAVTDPTVPAFLVGTTNGWLCVASGLTLQATGAWWMHRIVTGVVR